MKPANVRLRAPRPGDMGRVVQLHGAIYAREFGYDATFEALVAEIAAQFVRGFDPKRERIARAPHASFGKRLVAETWEMTL